MELGRFYGGAGVEVSGGVGLWRRDFKLLGRRGRDCSVDGGACYEICGCERSWRGSFRYSALLSIGFFSSYEWKCITPLRGSYHGVNILTMV